MILKNPMSLETQEQAPPFQAGLLTGDNLTVWEGDFLAFMLIKNRDVYDVMQHGVKVKETAEEKKKAADSDMLARV